MSPASQSANVLLRAIKRGARARTHIGGDLAAEALEATLRRLLEHILVQVLFKTIILLIVNHRLIATINFLMLFVRAHHNRLGKVSSVFGQDFARLRIVFRSSHRSEEILVVDFRQVARDTFYLLLAFFQRHGAAEGGP